MSNVRIAVAVLSLSAAGFAGIVLEEGYSDKAIVPVPGDVPTLGFGTTTGVRMGDTITPPQAIVRALNDVQRYEGTLKQCVTVPLHQSEYDAFVSLAYNVGPGAFCRSTLVRKLNAGDYRGACVEILRWRYFQGKDCAIAANRCSGLWKRRQEESRKCMESPK